MEAHTTSKSVPIKKCSKCDICVLYFETYPTMHCICLHRNTLLSHNTEFAEIRICQLCNKSPAEYPEILPIKCFDCFCMDFAQKFVYEWETTDRWICQSCNKYITLYPKIYPPKCTMCQYQNQINYEESNCDETIQT